MISVLPGFPENVLAFACAGQVTRADYRDILIPAVKAALERHRRVRVYYEVPAEFTGIDAAAVWEDFLVGMEHLSRWERMAVVSDVGWIRQAVNAFRFLMPGRLRVFPVSETAEARQWIAADIG
jgi:hypothetical protein